MRSILQDVSDGQLTLFKQLIAQEHEGFFGYHGAPQAVRIFQDFLKIGVEEVLGIAIRDDFLFLRIPETS